MYDIKINFTNKGAVIDKEEAIMDFPATVQEALINCTTIAGSDPLFPDRGTDLFTNALKGRLLKGDDIRHEANFASLETILFLNQHYSETDPFVLRDFYLEAIDFSDGQLIMNAVLTSVDDQTIGIFRNEINQS